MGWRVFRQTCGFSISFKLDRPTSAGIAELASAATAPLLGERKNKVILQNKPNSSASSRKKDTFEKRVHRGVFLN